MIRYATFIIGCTLTLLGIAPTVFASTVTTTMPVTATGASACSVSATGVAFGSYSGAAVTSSGSITVTCGIDVAYNITLDRGLTFGPGNLGTSRHMDSSGTTAGTLLAYSLYKDSGLTQEWGDAGFAGTYQSGTAVSGVGTGAAQTLTVYGKIPAGQTALPRVHSDTVVVTLIF